MVRFVGLQYLALPGTCTPALSHVKCVHVLPCPVMRPALMPVRYLNLACTSTCATPHAAEEHVRKRAQAADRSQRGLIDAFVAPQTEAHKARAAEVEQLRRELADAQAAAAPRQAGGTSAPLSLRSGAASASGDGGPGSNQGSMPVTPTASWTQVRLPVVSGSVASPKSASHWWSASCTAAHRRQRVQHLRHSEQSHQPQAARSPLEHFASQGQNRCSQLQHFKHRDILIPHRVHHSQTQGRRSTGGRMFGSHAGAAANGSDAFDFTEGAEAEEMDPEQLAALKEEVKITGVATCQRQNSNPADVSAVPLCTAQVPRCSALMFG